MPTACSTSEAAAVPSAGFTSHPAACSAFVLHSAEELPRFPAWATRHFGTTTTEFFVLSHIPLVALSATTSYLAERHGPGSIWATLATAWQWQLVVNGLFHLTATALFNEYSPGVITGTAVVFPASFYFDQTLRRDLLAPPRLWTALAIGSLVAGLAIASLGLDNDVRF